MNIRIVLLLSTVSSFIFTLNGQTELLNTDFESGIPATYTLLDNDGLIPDESVSEYTSAWIQTVDPLNELNSVAGSTSYFTTSEESDRWLITPAITLGAFGNFISWSAMSHDASFPDDYLVLVSTTDNALESFTDTIGLVMEEYAEWTNRSVDLSAEGYDNQTIYVAFVNRTTDGFKLYLDDVKAWKEDPVSVGDITSYEPSIYPNPFTSFIHIEFNQIIDSISLSTLSGQVVLSTVNSDVLSTESIPSGVYFLTLNFDGKSVTRKVVRQ